MKCIYELDVIKIVGERYPIRRAYGCRIGMFSTKEKAEKAIRNNVKKNNNLPIEVKDIILGYILKELLINDSEDNYSYICSYTADGTLNDVNMMDRSRKYHGRPKECIRFNVGDIVEVYGGQDVELCIVAATPPTTEVFLHIKQRAETEMEKQGIKGYQYEMDDSDDQYMVYPMRGDYHLHIRSELVFKPTKKVSKALRNQLQAQLKNPNI